MPIRTHRGRAAVYRRLWGWPLRSPRHLAAAVVGLAVAATTIGVLVPRTAAKTMQPPPRVAVDSSTTAPLPAFGGAPTVSSSLPTRLSSPPPPAPAAPAPEALAVAKGWTTAWVNHLAGVTAQQWFAGLRPFTTDEYLAVMMATVDPANVPATAVTGPPVAASATASSVEANVPTDAGNIVVRVIATQQGWRVSWYTKGS